MKLRELDPLHGDEKRYEAVDVQRWVHQTSRERFDRMAFAMRVLDLLRPEVDVVIYPRRGDFHIEHGRKLVRANAWATVGIPTHASRETIAYTLAELVGVEQHPLLLAALCRAAVD